MRVQRLLPLVATLALIACSNDDGGITAPTGPTTTASATIKAKGGSVRVEDKAGASLTVTFPGAALLTSTRVTLRAMDPPAGVKARFKIEPAGLDLNKPATFTVKLPDGKTPGAHDALVFTSGVPIDVPTEVDAANRTLTASLYHLGFDLPAPEAAASGSVALDDSGEFIDVHEAECQFLRDSLDNEILRAQAFVGPFPPSLATPLIQQYKAALLACLSPDSIAAASAALVQYACSNIGSAQTQAASEEIETAEDLKRVLGYVLAAEAISETAGAGCSVQNETIEGAFDEFLNAYIARINSPQFTRDRPTWDLLWNEIVKVAEVQALADEFDVFRAKNKITTELYPALYARLRGVAHDACEEEQNNSFLFDMVTGGFALNHPVTAERGLPEFTGFEMNDVVDEMYRCGSSLVAEAKTSGNGLLGTTTIDLDDREGAVLVTDAGKVVITDDMLGFTCEGGIVSRPPIRVFAEIPEHLPLVRLGNLSGSLSVNVHAVLTQLPPPEENELPSGFDLVFERDRKICEIPAEGKLELMRVHISTRGFVTELNGTWSGNCPSGPVLGKYTIQILDNGDVTGCFNGSASGQITGHVSGSGVFDATANGTAGNCNWTGSLNLDDGIVHGSGTWGCSEAGCTGEFSGSGAPLLARR